VFTYRILRILGSFPSPNAHKEPAWGKDFLGKIDDKTLSMKETLKRFLLKNSVKIKYKI